MYIYIYISRRIFARSSAYLWSYSSLPFLPLPWHHYTFPFTDPSTEKLSFVFFSIFPLAESVIGLSAQPFICLFVRLFASIYLSLRLFIRCFTTNCLPQFPFFSLRNAFTCICLFPLLRDLIICKNIGPLAQPIIRLFVCLFAPSILVRSFYHQLLVLAPFCRFVHRDVSLPSLC